MEEDGKAPAVSRRHGDRLIGSANVRLRYLKRDKKNKSVFQPRATARQSEAAADWLIGSWSRQADTEQISIISGSLTLNCEIKVKS